ncbi:MAG: hypothetical protein KF845_00440 [Cyclobacteriaceae bacterium]|nr:hypothetical protein [Cyclobacteriaceae bacterium]
MKIIDIHTKKKPKRSPQKRIDEVAVKNYVFQHIDFELTNEYWDEIDSEFAEIWNNKIGVGGYFYWDEISKDIYNALQEKKMLISYDRVDCIVNLMLTYIEDTGGFMDL